MPAYNAANYIDQAIQSVFNQTYSDWELLIIDDGSIDETKHIVDKYLSDCRVKYVKKENGGVSSARNVGLSIMKGGYFCFLDADDVFPPESIKSRVIKFRESSKLQFVDGEVLSFKENPTNVITNWRPKLKGNPFKDLVRLGGRSFMGISWMIKRDENRTYSFSTNTTHCEDLDFYINLARTGGVYDFVDTTILYYRRQPNSAMSNIDGLAEGYRWLFKKIIQYSEVSNLDRLFYKFRYHKIILLSYARLNKDYKKAFKSLFHLW
jgi:glycosyltransferase involved in cell wall biosynthesis